jgi:hypothetical protein
VKDESQKYGPAVLDSSGKPLDAKKMNRKGITSGIFRIVFFMLLFSIGAAAMGLSVLCEDLVKYYSNVEFTESAQQSIAKLDNLNHAYDSILQNLKEDPNIYRRIAAPAIGSQYLDANAVYPRVAARQLAAARKALADPNEETIEPVIPAWLSRCSEPHKRMALFISGVALILISFVCFRPLKNFS